MNASLIVYVLIVGWLGCGIAAVVLTAVRRPYVFEGMLGSLGIAVAGVALGPIALYAAMTEVNDEL